jgi:hypothetical protein
MPDRDRPWSTLNLLALIFLASGVGLVAAADWLMPVPAEESRLVEVDGTVEKAWDIKQHEEPADTTSFALWVRANGEPVRLDLVRQDVKPAEVRALVGKTIAAKQLDGLIYELKSGDATLISYAQTARIVAGDKAVVRWSGLTSLAIGAVLFFWSAASKPAPSRLNEVFGLVAGGPLQPMPSPHSCSLHTGRLRADRGGVKLT